MYPNYNNEIKLELLDTDNQVLDEKTINVQTDELPDTLLDVVKTAEYTQESAMGLLMVTGLRTPYIYAFDQAGDIRWYCSWQFEYYGAFPLANGNFLMEAEDVLMPNASMPNSPQFYEMDYLGRVYNAYFFPEGVHHEIKEKSLDGNFLIATNSNNGYEQDMIQEIDRETGQVIKSLNLTEIMEGCKYIDQDDWAHINTVSYDDDTDTILISPRNIHSGIRINWTTDEIEWILSDPVVWEGTEYEDKVLSPIGDINWHYEQHTVYEVKEDVDNDPKTIHIMLYDNHNITHRPVETYDNDDNSYVKLYTVNVEDKTVKLEHSYETVYSHITSNFIYEPEANRLFSICANLAKKTEGALGMIYEFDAETEEVINRYLISHRFYRAYNIEFDANKYAGKYELSDNYIKGDLSGPVAVETAKNITADKTIKNEVTLTMKDSILYLRAVDHGFTQLIFNGTDHTYVYDISSIKYMHQNGKNYKYSLPIPLNGLEIDTYSLSIMYDDDLYQIDQTITINK